MNLIKYPFPLDDYTVGYLELPYEHHLTAKEVKRLTKMMEAMSLEEGAEIGVENG